MPLIFNQFVKFSDFIGTEAFSLIRGYRTTVSDKPTDVKHVTDSLWWRVSSKLWIQKCLMMLILLPTKPSGLVLWKKHLNTCLFRTCLTHFSRVSHFYQGSQIGGSQNPGKGWDRSTSSRWWRTKERKLLRHTGILTTSSAETPKYSMYHL